MLTGIDESRALCARFMVDMCQLIQKQFTIKANVGPVSFLVGHVGGLFVSSQLTKQCESAG